MIIQTKSHERNARPTDIVKFRMDKCKQPKMNDRNGKCWEYHTRKIDGKDHKFWLDIVWGEYLYLYYAGDWYKCRFNPPYFIRRKGQVTKLNTGAPSLIDYVEHFECEFEKIKRKGKVKE